MKAKSTVVLVIGSLLLAVFLSLMFTYQVRSNEIVLVDSWSGGWKIKYGSATTVTDGNETSMEVKSDAGIQFRLPWPLEKVYKLDGRTHVLETGFDEELGAGGETLLVSVYAGWHVNNANLFRDNFGDQRTAGLMMRAADEKLRDYVESARDEVLGGTKLFMTPEQMEFRKENQANLTYMKAEKKIKEIVSTKAKGLGLGIKFLGIKRVGLPETQANGIIEGMVQLKKTKIEALNQETQQQSEAIQNTATTESRAIIEKAESNATRLRNEARSKVSEIYAQADSSPEKARLAITLKQIKALEVLRSEGKQIQLIISDNHPLFNVFDEAMQKQAPKK